MKNGGSGQGDKIAEREMSNFSEMDNILQVQTENGSFKDSMADPPLSMFYLLESYITFLRVL